MGRRMRPHNPPKEFGLISPGMAGRYAKEDGKTIEANPYRQGTDDYKRWKEGFRKASRKA